MTNHLGKVICPGALGKYSMKHAQQTKFFVKNLSGLLVFMDILQLWSLKPAPLEFRGREETQVGQLISDVDGSLGNLLDF
jgi:hypothetical protein